MGEVTKCPTAEGLALDRLAAGAVEGTAKQHSLQAFCWDPQLP